MKKLATLAGLAALMLSVFSCTDQLGFEKPEADDSVITISASVERSASATKTSLNDNLETVWTEGDGISLLASGVNYEFRTSLLKDDGLRADFSHEGTIANQSYYAVYPYSSSTTFDGTSISAELPTVQTAVAGSFAQSANLAVAYADWGQTFKFKNAVAMVKISFHASEGAHIRKVTFRSLDETVLLSGSVSLTPTLQSSEVSNVSLAVTSGVPYVSLVAPSGTDLSLDTDYYIAVAPAALTSGYVIEFENEEGLVFSKTYDAAGNKATLERNKISATGRKNFDNYETSGYFRVRSSETNNHPGVGEYLVVYKMSDGSYRIINEDRTDTYIVKGTHFELSGSGMAFTMSYRREQMEGMVAYVFRNAWLSSAVPDDGISFANDELIMSPQSIGLTVGTYKVSSTKYYYANVILYNRTDNTQITLTLDNLACSLSSSDAGTISGKFNTKSASTNPGGNPNTCDNLVDALLKHATFSGFDSLVRSTAISALKGDDNAFTGAFTTATHTTKNGIVCQNHFMIKTEDLLQGVSLSNIWLYKFDTKTYAYYINHK